jgi:hypothetical protein
MPPQESNRQAALQPSGELTTCQTYHPLLRQTTKILPALDLNWRMGQIEVLPVLAGGVMGTAEGHDPSVVVEAGSFLPPALLWSSKEKESIC